MVIRAALNLAKGVINKYKPNTPGYGYHMGSSKFGTTRVFGTKVDNRPVQVNYTNGSSQSLSTGRSIANSTPNTNARNKAQSLVARQIETIQLSSKNNDLTQNQIRVAESLGGTKQRDGSYSFEQAKVNEAIALHEERFNLIHQQNQKIQQNKAVTVRKDNSLNSIVDTYSGKSSSSSRPNVVKTGLEQGQSAQLEQLIEQRDNLQTLIQNAQTKADSIAAKRGSNNRNTEVESLYTEAQDKLNSLKEQFSRVTSQAAGIIVSAKGNEHLAEMHKNFDTQIASTDVATKRDANGKVINKSQEQRLIDGQQEGIANFYNPQSTEPSSVKKSKPPKNNNTDKPEAPKLGDDAKGKETDKPEEDTRNFWQQTGDFFKHLVIPPKDGNGWSIAWRVALGLPAIGIAFGILSSIWNAITGAGDADKKRQMLMALMAQAQQQQPRTA